MKELKRYFPSYVKLLVSLLSVCTNEKNTLQKEIKDSAFEFYLLTGEPSQFMTLLIESLKMTYARSFVWFLNFLSNQEGWDCFL